MSREPWICMHGTNIDEAGTCAACMVALDLWLAPFRHKRLRPRRDLVCVVNVSRVPLLVESVDETWARGVFDDFARIPADKRAAFQRAAASHYGFASYADLRREVFG